MRSRLGFNNNPSPLEFKHIYRRLLLGVTYGVVNYANIELQDDSEIVSIIPCTKSKIENISETYNLGEIDMDFINSVTLSKFADNAIEYIAGYVVKQVSSKIVCDECRAVIIGKQPDKVVNLICLKDYGNYMCYPSQAANKLFNIAEKILDAEVKTCNWLSKKNFFDILCVKIVKFFIENVNFRMHCIHKYSLIMKLTSCFVSIKLKHYSKLENENIKLRRIRNKLTRVIINNHE